jgi:protein ImuA
MSLGGRSEQVGVLRDVIARLEGDGAAATHFADPRPLGTPGIRLGRDLALDGVLRGGLRRGALHEIVAARPGDAGAASGFALALAARFAAGTHAPVVWILEDAARAETGHPYAPGLRAHGIDPDRLIVVGTANGQDSLWAMEEALKCRAVGAVVVDLWRTKSYDLVASRRLVLAAQASGTPGLLVRAGAAGRARALSSAAQTRFEVRAMPGTAVRSAGAAVPSVGHRLPIPGRAAWAVRLARIRAGPGTIGFDWEKFWPLAWDHDEAWFCDALPLPSSALAADRPYPQVAGGDGVRRVACGAPE